VEFFILRSAHFLSSLYKYLKENWHHLKALVEYILNIPSTSFTPWVIYAVGPLEGVTVWDSGKASVIRHFWYSKWKPVLP